MDLPVPLPIGIPDRLKPVLYAKFLRINREVSEPAKAKQRITAELFAFAEVVYGLAKDGEFSPHFAIDSIVRFIHTLCIFDKGLPEYMATYLQENPTETFEASLTKDIRDSDRWLEYIEKFAALAEVKKQAEDSLETGTPQTTPKSKRMEKVDLSKYLEVARLTDKQYECASLRWEYGLSVAAIARKLRVARVTVDQHLEYAQKKMRAAGLYERVRKHLAKTNPEG